MSTANATGMIATRKIATAVYEAGQVARRMREKIRTGSGVRKKGPGNFITEADKAVEVQLRKSLLSIAPDTTFSSEENPHTTGPNGSQGVVDPIDGTGNYLSNMPYAISVAYQQDGDTILGMVYEPETDRLYWAHRGHKAFVVQSMTEIMPCYMEGMVGGGWLGKPIERSDEADVAIIGMPYDRNRTDDILGIAKRLHERFGDVKRIGPASLDICRVAIGDAAIYAEYNLGEWDWSAASLIAQEAGCVCEHRGNLLICGSRNAIMCFDADATTEQKPGA